MIIMEPRFSILIMKLIAGEISGDERAQFDDMIEDENREEEFKTILSELFEEQRNTIASEYQIDDAAWEKMVQTILKGGSVEVEPVISNTEKAVLLNERMLSATLVRRIPIRKLNWIITAAASVIAFVGLTVYFGFFNKNRSVVVPKENIPLVHDVAPGGNRALLILSTGQQIALDSAKNGQLAKFGNTTISKTDSGKLLYASAGSKASKDETDFNELITPRGGIYELVLPDGTKAWLNAASRIAYPTRFSGKKREVFINGEVYFEVAHDATHPFLVSLPAKTKEQGENGHWMQIEVLGTHFNVNAYSDNKNADPNSPPDLAPTRTTLLEGSIKIKMGQESQLVKPGEQAVAGFSLHGIEIRRNVDLDKVMAWRNGKMVFTDVSVRQLMTEISRWYDVDIEYSGSVPNKQFYGSVSRNVPLSTVLKALKTYGVETKVEGKKIIVQ